MDSSFTEADTSSHGMVGGGTMENRRSIIAKEMVR
jgi:hypothetical protein